jgi:VWFA-related protein
MAVRPYPRLAGFAPCLLFLCVSQTPAQNPPNSPEMATRDATPTFTTRSNLVLVRVVVRDKQGNVNGTLHKEDFEIFDKGKPQFISKFAVEKTEGRKADAVASEDAPVKSGEPAPPPLPDRYIAYVFDDLNLSIGDLAQARTAAERQLSEGIPATTRAAVYTTSGQTMLDFTDDVAKLRDALSRIRSQTLLQGISSDCPHVSFYWADLIQNKNDPQALNAATREAMACASLDPTMISAAQSMARAAATRTVNIGEQNTRVTLKLLNDIVRRISSMPGQRSVILVSPGFLVFDDERVDEVDLMDRAIRNNVTISGLDARGLYVLVPGGDASEAGGSLSTLIQRSQYQSVAATVQGDVLGELADGTGGAWFHNRNDLAEGFKRLAVAPEYYYVLGFSPETLKFDGSYHGLKVSIKKPAGVGLTLQARRGYYAPKHEVDAAQEAKREIEETLFSREEWHDIPVELHTQFFKSTDVNAKLSIVARVDVRQLHFRKTDGRNLDVLTCVAGIFDRNGNYIGAVEKTEEMRLKDDTLAGKLTSGITVRSAFDVTPGSYFVRIVVRDAEGQKMAALNGSVEIP